MRAAVLTIAAAAGLSWLGFAATEADAQNYGSWAPGYYYTQHPAPVGIPRTAPIDPAYRYFLNSPSSYKTFSTTTPGTMFENGSPFGFQQYYTDPRYIHQRVTPYGFEDWSTTPGYGGTTITPFSYQNFRVPGYQAPVFIPRYYP